MTLEQLMKAFNYLIEGGSEHMWKCYPDARYIDFNSQKSGAYGTLLHSTVDHTVYEATVYADDQDGKTLGPYRWRNPDFIEAYRKESKSRGIDENVAWDDQKWIDLEVEEDFLEKAAAIFRGRGFDNRIQVPLEIDDNVLFQLMQEAHRQDITLNQLVTNLLQAEIDAHAVLKEEPGDIEHSKYWYDYSRNRGD